MEQPRGRWGHNSEPHSNTADASMSRRRGASGSPTALSQTSDRKSNGDTAAGGATGNPTFDCNICLDTVSSPVVTLCGHLYCWPCLFQWMEARSECPVCKAGISVENVIPVYGRGTEAVDPRTQDEMRENGIPSRPHGQRPDAEQLRRRRPQQFGIFNTNHGGQGFTMSPTIGFFPALFGLPFQSAAAVTHRPDGTPLSPMEVRQQVQQAFLSRLLLMVGSLVILCLLAF